jgi:perosamine synthetase
MSYKYPLFKVNMPANIEQKMKPILESGYISEGPYSKEFELKFQAWLGNPYVSVLNSGTAAITIALRLANVNPGDEVITSPLTCLAMNEPILSVGGVPVFCDIDPNTGNIDPEKIEQLITNKTKAILFVDWAGNPAPSFRIKEIAEKHNLKTIEDAAHALGATLNEKKIGTISHFTCFSFQAIKHMTTIDGGAIACSNKEDYDRAVLLRWFGCRRGHNTSPVKWEGDVLEYGYKMHLADVNAIIGIESLKTIDSIIGLHQKNGKLLESLLEDSKSITLLEKSVGSAHWIFTFKCKDSAHRDLLSKDLLSAGIFSSIVHTRNDAYSLFKGYPPRKEMKGTDEFSDKMLNIPCGWWLTTEDIEFIAKEVLSK